MGPECAPQQKKNVAARIANSRERRACERPMPGPGPGDAVPAAGAAEGAADRTKKAAGTSVAHTSAARIACAVRQSTTPSSHAAKGESVMGATPTPTDTSDTARLRRRSNHEV